MLSKTGCLTGLNAEVPPIIRFFHECVVPPDMAMSARHRMFEYPLRERFVLGPILFVSREKLKFSQGVNLLHRFFSEISATRRGSQPTSQCQPRCSFVILSCATAELDRHLIATVVFLRQVWWKSQKTAVSPQIQRHQL